MKINVETTRTYTITLNEGEKLLVARALHIAAARWESHGPGVVDVHREAQVARDMGNLLDGAK